MIGGAAAQVASTTLDSNAIMGFETPAAWIALSDRASSTTVSSTTTRTQGSFAYALMNPGDLTTLTSLPVASTARALTGVGDVGALLQVDVMLPTQQGNPVNRGSLQLFIGAPSRQLNNVLIGMVDFTPFRRGIYSTIKFPIPDNVRAALGGATFSDLTFQFMLHSPGTGAGTYLFDNLRVHSVPPVTGGPGVRPPAGYGGSVDLVAIGGAPAAQLFDAGPVQVPDSFHLKLGSAGTTTAQLDIGYDGAPAFTCTYGADSSDPTGKTYRLTSCTGGVQAGDLVGASWAQLTIVGGDASVKIRAQLAKNPIGDLVGGGIIPAMPTFWGDIDGCVPAPVPGQIVTISPSCASEAAQASQIVTDYFNKVNNSNVDSNWIVTPTPEFARRTGNGSPNNNLTGPPPRPNDPPFDQEGHVCLDCKFDAYWRLFGNFETTPDNHFTTHFDANFSTHVVLFGGDVNVLSLNSAIDTDTGQVMTTGFGSPSSTSSLHMFLFGVEVPGGGSGGAFFNYNFGDSHDLNLPPIQIWIFSITLGATGSVGVVATGSLSPAGFDVSLTPHASMGLHAEGGVNLGIASGGVDVRVNLLEVSTPMSARASWSIDTRPSACSSLLNSSLDGVAEISSGGGEVDLVASFGICPACHDESWTIFRWNPVVTYVTDLFNTNVANQLSQLPVSLCKVPLTVTITSPSASIVASGIPIALQGTAYSSNNQSFAPCAGFTWSLSDSVAGELDPSSGKGCNVTMNLASSPASRTLTLSAVYDIPNQFPTIGTIEETGAAPKSIAVTILPPGPYIVQTVPAPNGTPQSPYNQPLTIDVLSLPSVIQLVGLVVGATGSTTTTWAANTTTPIGTGINVNWNVNAAGIYTITMTTTDSGGTASGTATVPVTVRIVPR
jgi:hypothetical protein